MKINTTLKPKVFVAMSGGVDSSTAAALLKKGGFDVVGIYMKQWSPKGFRCPWAEDRQDALRVAVSLGIPFETWDFSKQYKKLVADYMIREYKAGRTPNPDVLCNRDIKFGLFMKKALAEGADFVATGHYARIRNGKLLAAKDKNKDQTYFLYALTGKQLEKILFPVGGYTKAEVRKLARKFNLPVADKKDSQGVCFVGEFDMKDFLKKYIKPKKGKVVFGKETVGEHDGVFYYTIGQRHGLGLSGGPYFVAGKDVKKNIIYVSKDPEGKEMKTKKAYLEKVNWINEKPESRFRAKVKIRYRTEAIDAYVKPGRKTALEFVSPAKALTPGQAAVIYGGQVVLGGGTIL